MENVVIYEDLPGRVRGFTVVNNDGSYTIIINSKLNYEQQKNTYTHEIYHIQNNDFSKDINIDLIEYCAHNFA